MSKKSLVLLSFLIGAKLFAGDCDPLMEEIRKDPRSETGYYKVACCYALEGNREEAFYYLDLALEAGLKNADWIESDKHLQGLHGDARWADVLEQARKHEAVYLKGVNERLYRLFKDDFADQRTQPQDLAKKNASRVTEVDQLIKQGKLKRPDDFYHAAMILYHGDQRALFHRAYQLAKKAANLDPAFSRARSLTCHAQDRWLHSIGKPQIWGTQLRRENEKHTLEPFDQAAVTDAQRRDWHVRTLEEAKEWVKDRNGQ